VIEIPFDPNIHLGPLTLAWHGIFTAVGIFFGVGLAIRLIRGRVSEDDGYAIATWGVVCGIVSARLLHVADRWDLYAENPLQILAIWSGGIAIWGAVIGGTLGGFVVALRLKVPIGFTADAAAPSIGLGLALGRIGDVINGEHHTIACADLPFCVSYTFPPQDGGLGQLGPVHLAVGYEMVVVLATVLGALWLRRRLAGVAPAGFVFWLWVLAYGLTRYTISFLRIEDPTPFFGLRQDQLIGLGAVLIAIPMLLVLAARGRRPLAP